MIDKLLNQKKRKEIRHQVLSMTNHGKLIEEFILVVLEDSEILHRFIIHNDLEIKKKPN